jgi:hypothetical protein
LACSGMKGGPSTSRSQGSFPERTAKNADASVIVMKLERERPQKCRCWFGRGFTFRMLSNERRLNFKKRFGAPAPDFLTFPGFFDNNEIRCHDCI